MTYTLRAGFVRYSSNRKIGPIPVATTESKTCPSTCPLKGNGCFADYGPMKMKWKVVDGIRQTGMKVKSWQELCDSIRKLPRGQIWRHNDAGDLPGDENEINTEFLVELVESNKGRKGFTYTHKPVGVRGQKIFEENKRKYKFSYEQALTNLMAVKSANQKGFRINLSADSLAEADELYDLNIGPVAVTCPSGVEKHTKTPKGRHVIVCPAQHSDITCYRCQLCAKDRKAIVGFIAHGPGAKKVNKRLNVLQ